MSATEAPVLEGAGYGYPPSSLSAPHYGEAAGLDQRYVETEG